MVKEILTYPENKDILTQKSELVDFNENVTEIIQDMKDTLNNTSGCGISAVQIGVLKRICLIKIDGQIITMINPEITRMRGENIKLEGCLSAPKEYREVKRAEKVWCEYIDENDNRKEIAIGGLCSRIIQHEIDHFEGWCEVFDNLKEK